MLPSSWTFIFWVIHDRMLPGHRQEIKEKRQQLLYLNFKHSSHALLPGFLPRDAKDGSSNWSVPQSGCFLLSLEYCDTPPALNILWWLLQYSVPAAVLQQLQLRPSLPPSAREQIWEGGLSTPPLHVLSPSLVPPSLLLALSATVSK